MKWLSLLFLFVFGVKLKETTADDRAKFKTVSTLLNAKWNSTPLALEISEFLNDEDPSFFWSFVEDVYKHTEPLSEKTDKTQYETLIDIARQYLGEAQISLMKFSLSLHVYSPKVEMFQQIALVRGIQEECEAVADVNGELTCDPEQVASLLKASKRNAEIHKLDHKYPGTTAEDKPVVILYGEIGTKSLNDFHLTLKTLAEAGDVTYILRHFSKNRVGPKVRLSGYGVELQIKSTEYKAQDDTKVKAEQSGAPGSDFSGTGNSEIDEDEEIEGFLFNKLKHLNPDLSSQLDKLKQQLLDETHEMAPLKVWQLQELSLQAAERILSSSRDESLKVMTQLAQNFPALARSLVRSTVRPALKEDIRRNQHRFSNELNISPSESALFINGQHFNMDAVDMFTLFDQIREELKLVEGLHKIGVGSQYVSSLLSLDLTPPSRQYAVDIRDSAVTYINDIESDAQYKRWSANINELLQPSYPGMLRRIRRNMYNLILVVDPVRKEGRSIIKLAESFYIHSAPLRIGIVLAVNSDRQLTGLEDAGVAVSNAFNYVSQRTNAYDALSFITDLFALVGDDEITVKDVENLLKKKFSADIEEVLGEDSDYDVGRQLTKDFLRRTGFRKLPQVLLNGVALDDQLLNSDDFEEAVLSELMRQTATIQKALFKGEMRDQSNVLDFLMSQPNVMPRLNDRVLSTATRYLDMTGGGAHGTKDVQLLSARDLTIRLADSTSYVASASSTKKLIPISTWLVADVTNPAGRQLVRNTIDYVRNSRLMRLGLVHNSGSLLTSHQVEYVEMLQLALQTNDIRLLDNLLKEENALALMDGSKSSNDFGLALLDGNPVDLELHQLFSRRALEFLPGQRGLVINGRVIGPLENDEEFTEDDVALLEKHTMSLAGEKILQFVEDFPNLHNSDLVMKITGLLFANPTPKSRVAIDDFNSELSMLHFDPKSEHLPFVDITAIVDPLSAGAQKIAPLLIVLQEVLNCRVRVFLNCVEKHSEMPLKSFYRLVLEPDLMFGADERLLPGPMAKFGVLPLGALLTQNLQVPDNWLVESVWSPYDLDNIRLDGVDTDVHSEYELEHLILEGHCFDQATGSPPRGLQLTLGTPLNPIQVDTIVMANLGYLQLKANPGSWILRLRDGRSTEIYDISSHDGTDTPTGSSSSGSSGDIHVLISSFKSHVLKLKVNKKSGKQHMDLLSSDDEDSNGLWNSITSTFSSKPVDEEDNKLNIFSLASGHLYERFIRIMMLSVLKNTKTPVKFWFLKNYLSPTLKDFLPHMAKEYGFEYELVEYKWPRWLHQQKEKQRIIWGYKILFLDVLFPLNIKKIIFVDADQVVRADLTELRDLDLGGAPYGYTPFCDSRREMDGFRFWKSGYWKNHLQGRKYHISALYVVDLKRFRRIAAGDRLRGQYQALSQDPNSLSNLDQDLPNNMIHQVPIKSLPQEWLWCETWCDNVSKQKAKTIDLCNNPMTKEAKLDAAVRIVGEWNDYDQEVKALQQLVADTKSQQPGHDPSEL